MIAPGNKKINQTQPFNRKFFIFVPNHKFFYLFYAINK